MSLSELKIELAQSFGNNYKTQMYILREFIYWPKKLTKERFLNCAYDDSPHLDDISRPFEEKSLEAQCHGNTLEYVRTIKRPRVIKTHLPFSHLPQNLLEKAKVVYVCRGAKDQIVSYYHHMCLDDTVKMDVEEFARHMMKSRIHYGDYFAHLKVNSI